MRLGYVAIFLIGWKLRASSNFTLSACPPTCGTSCPSSDDASHEALDGCRDARTRAGVKLKALQDGNRSSSAASGRHLQRNWKCLPTPLFQFLNQIHAYIIGSHAAYVLLISAEFWLDGVVGNRY
jgi:hypothetical protein